MSDAPRDGNGVPAILAVLNTDTVQGTNLVPVLVNSSNNGIKTNTSATISFTMQPIDPRDQNYAHVWCFKGSNGLVYPAVATSAGELLITYA
jgi:hypothetical protein